MRPHLDESDADSPMDAPNPFSGAPDRGGDLFASLDQFFGRPAERDQPSAPVASPDELAEFFRRPQSAPPPVPQASDLVAPPAPSTAAVVAAPAKATVIPAPAAPAADPAQAPAVSAPAAPAADTAPPAPAADSVPSAAVAPAAAAAPPSAAAVP